MATTPLSEMRVLTVRQPWAWAIIHGGKDVENRVRNIAGGYRGPVAIHVAQQIDTQAMTSPTPPMMAAAQDYVGRNPDPLDGGPWFRDRGVIIGVVDLEEVHPLMGSWSRTNEWQVTCCASPWADSGYTETGGLGQRDIVHIVLANPRALDEPIPYKGALGLRRLAPEIAERIIREVE